MMTIMKDLLSKSIVDIGKKQRSTEKNECSTYKRNGIHKTCSYRYPGNYKFHQNFVKPHEGM